MFLVREMEGEREREEEKERNREISSNQHRRKTERIVEIYN